MSNYSKHSPKREAGNRKAADPFLDGPLGKNDSYSNDILFGGTFEAVPALNSPKMNKRFSRRLKHLLDKI